MATNSPGHVARLNPDQVVNTLALHFAWNTTNVATGIPFPAYIPQGATILRTTVNATTAFNAGTTNTVSIGDNASSYNDMMNAQTVTSAGSFQSTIGGWGTAATNLAAGDVRPYLIYAQTGGSATAGAGVAVIEYATNFDA